MRIFVVDNWDNWVFNASKSTVTSFWNIQNGVLCQQSRLKEPAILLSPKNIKIHHNTLTDVISNQQKLCRDHSCLNRAFGTLQKLPSTLAKLPDVSLLTALWRTNSEFNLLGPLSRSPYFKLWAPEGHLSNYRPMGPFTTLAFYSAHSLSQQALYVSTVRKPILRKRPRSHFRNNGHRKHYPRRSHYSFLSEPIDHLSLGPKILHCILSNNLQSVVFFESRKKGRRGGWRQTLKGKGRGGESVR